MATKKSAGNVEQQDAIASFLARKGIKDSKEVSSASWKWETGVLKYFKVLGLPVKRDRRPGEVKEPPFVCPVKDLETQEHRTLICNTMLFNQFQSYPDDELIGKCFVSMMSDVEGKNWKAFDTREVPDPEA
jgi:hypothetical protein